MAKTRGRPATWMWHKAGEGPSEVHAERDNGRSWVVPRRNGRPDGEQLGRATLLLEEGSHCLGEAAALRRRLAPD